MTLPMNEMHQLVQQCGAEDTLDALRIVCISEMIPGTKELGKKIVALQTIMMFDEEVSDKEILSALFRKRDLVVIGEELLGLESKITNRLLEDDEEEVERVFDELREAVKMANDNNGKLDKRAIAAQGS